MKKIIVLIFTLLLAFALSSCGDKTTPVANQNPVSPAETHSPAPNDNNPPPAENGTQDTVPDNQTVIPDEGTPTTASDPVADGEPPTETDSPTPTPDVGNSTSTGTGTQNTVPDNQAVIPGQGTSTAANDPIKDILGVDYTISPTEYTFTAEYGTYRLRRVEVQSNLNLDRFTMSTWGNIIFGDSVVPMATGEIIIITIPNNSDDFLRNWMVGSSNSVMIINIGLPQVNEGVFVINPINTGSIPAPQETMKFDINVEWTNDFHTEQSNVEWTNDFHAVHKEQIEWALSTFNMSRHYTSDNFDWYSNNVNRHYLPYKAEMLEARMPEIIEAFGGPLEKKISIFIFSIDEIIELVRYMNPDWNICEEYGIASAFWGWEHNAVKLTWNSNWWEQGFIHRNDGIFIPENVIDVYVHEVVHVFQHRTIRPNGPITWDVQRWIMEGTAHYFERGFYEWMYHLDLLPNERVKNNNIPSLDDISGTEAEPWNRQRDLYRPWGYTIVRFVSETWGFDYVLELNRRMDFHEDIFGISRTEFENQWHQWLRNTFG
jgi:hypothetical protein